MPQVKAFLEAIADLEEEELKRNSVSTRAANLEDNKFKAFIKE